MTLRILVRGGGDLASGVILRLFRAGWQVLVTELAEPRAVRRYVSFSQAVYDGFAKVEEVTARRADSLSEAESIFLSGDLPVIVDAGATSRRGYQPQILIDARMTKQPPETGLDAVSLMIGLGPGFTAGVNCHAVVETNRGPWLGRVIWGGSAQADTGIPERVGEYQTERVLRAPVSGVFEGAAKIGSLVVEGQVLATVADQVITSPFSGVIRGLAMDGLVVTAGEKVGDVDPRSDPSLCWHVSDKALAVGGGVLEAVLVWMRRNRTSI